MLISGGGTGGHVYPALTVAEALKARQADAEVLYVGSVEGMERELVERAGWPYRGVDAGQVRGMSAWALLRNGRRLWRGVRQAQALLAEWPADVVLVTGGYVTVPVALAAWLRRIPILIYLPDLEPGWAVRFLSRLATRVAVSFDRVQRFFDPKKVWVSGYPVRAGLFNVDRSAGYRALGLDPTLKTLLVFGGSRGAQSINRAIGAILEDLLRECQIVHVTGTLDWPNVEARRNELPPDLRVRYHIYPYMHEELMAAFATADLVVSRAGAATLAEWPALGLPSVLVPYPYSGQHQQRNADFMVEHGAAVCVRDADMSSELEPILMNLLRDPDRLKRMGEQARALSQPEAADKLAAELIRLSRQGEE